MAGQVPFKINPFQPPEGFSPEQESVFDPLYETLIKKAARGLGYDDPNSSIEGLMGGMGVPAGLISKLPNLNKIRVAARNKDLVDDLITQNTPDLVMKPVEFALNKYPRLMAHLRDIKAVEEIPAPPGLTTFGQHLAYKNPPRGFTSSIEIARKIKGSNPLPPEQQVAETFGHELTHAAQNLWNQKKFIDSASSMPQGVAGYNTYFNNPYEVGARKAGENFRKKMFEPASVKKLKPVPEPVTRPDDSVISKLLSYITGE